MTQPTPTAVRRYGFNSEQLGMRREPNGEYVLHSDYQQLEQTNAELRALVALARTLKSKMERCEELEKLADCMAEAIEGASIWTLRMPTMCATESLNNYREFREKAALKAGEGKA